MVPPRRKKWTEAEEKTLIDKYGEMVGDGTIAKMKTREKKYKPIALYVNSVHHVRDPITFPWHWTWKDVSTKVQNMRHQFLLVKQKIKKSDLSVDNSVAGDCNGDEFHWVEGLTHWSNFLRYKEVFGDVAASYDSNINNGSDLMLVIKEDGENSGGFVGVGDGVEITDFGQMGHSADGDFPAIDGGENGVMSLDFEYGGDDEEGNFNGNHGMVRGDGDTGFAFEEVVPNGSNLKKRRKMLKVLEKKTMGFLANRLGQLREMEAQYEQHETDREKERQRRENFQIKLEQEWEQKLEEREKEREEREMAKETLKRQRNQEWETMEESEERERRRRDAELIQEREWGERVDRRRSEWNKRVDEMLSQHRAEMGQMLVRILHEQQNVTSQLLGIVSQWSGHPTGLSDHTGASSHYLSQMMQNLHNMNGMVYGDTRVEGDNQDDQFTVDG